jgi:hypothetical protein
MSCQTVSCQSVAMVSRGLSATPGTRTRVQRAGDSNRHRRAAQSIHVRRDSHGAVTIQTGANSVALRFDNTVTQALPNGLPRRGNYLMLLARRKDSNLRPPSS